MKDRLCEAIDDHGKTCGAPGYSWSADHENLVYCRSCFMRWQKDHKVQSAKAALESLTPAEKKALIEAIGGATK